MPPFAEQLYVMRACPVCGANITLWRLCPFAAFAGDRLYQTRRRRGVSPRVHAGDDEASPPPSWGARAPKSAIWWFSLPPPSRLSVASTSKTTPARTSALRTARGPTRIRRATSSPISRYVDVFYGVLGGVPLCTAPSLYTRPDFPV